MNWGAHYRLVKDNNVVQTNAPHQVGLCCKLEPKQQIKANMPFAFFSRCNCQSSYDCRRSNSNAAINLHFVEFVAGARPEIRNRAPNERYGRPRRAHPRWNDVERPGSEPLNANKDVRWLPLQYLHRTALMIIKMILFVPSNKNNNK